MPGTLSPPSQVEDFPHLSGPDTPPSTPFSSAGLERRQKPQVYTVQLVARTGSPVVRCEEDEGVIGETETFQSLEDLTNRVVNFSLLI